MINKAGADLIKRWESFKDTPYKDSAGNWTIGYGTTHNVHPDMPPITEGRAEELLVDHIENEIEPYFQRWGIEDTLNENQKAALASLIYNVGAGSVSRSRLLKHIKVGDTERAANEFLRGWDTAGGRFLPGLKYRRYAEHQLFLTPDNTEKTDET